MTDFDKLINSEDAAHNEAALSKGVRTLLDRDLRKELDAAIRQQINPSQVAHKAVVKKMLPLRWLSIAASFVVLVVATFWWLNQSPSVSPQQYAITDIMVHPGVSKGSGDSKPQRANAITAFNAQDWQAAIASWSATDLTTEESRYYLALSYFYAGQYNEANIRFATLTSANSVYSQEVKWFYGLSLILNGEKDRGKQVLSTIAQDEWHYKEAQSLLTE